MLVVFKWEFQMLIWSADMSKMVFQSWRKHFIEWFSKESICAQEADLFFLAEVKNNMSIEKH